MNELILLCAGAAADTTDDTAGVRAGLPVPPLPGLSALLARGRIASDRSLEGDPVAELPEDAWLRERLSIPEPVSVQALECVIHDVPMPCWRLTPCQLHLGMDHAMLIDPGQLRLTADESAALAAAAAPAFEAMGLTLRAPCPEVWFASGPPWSLTACAWTLASGRNISAYEPRGARARDWRRLLTEVQMLWYEHPVNVAREQAGQRPVNALWLDGFASEAPPPGSGLMVSASPVLTGAARAAGWDTRHAPGAAQALAPAPGAAGQPIIIDLPWWRAPRRLGDAPAWQEAWQSFEDWLQAGQAPLARAADQRRLRVVLTGERRLLTLDSAPTSRWRFWQRLDVRSAINGGAPASTTGRASSPRSPLAGARSASSDAPRHRR
ncbi:MAG: hypothetical protein NTV19_04590 [Burkholderiales bacterium]|nr:hypothetical protein [Burkholderiales bacterium]